MFSSNSLIVERSAFLKSLRFIIYKPFPRVLLNLPSVFFFSLRLFFFESLPMKFVPHGKPLRYPPFDRRLRQGVVIRTQVAQPRPKGRRLPSAHDPANSCLNYELKPNWLPLDWQLSIGLFTCPVQRVDWVACPHQQLGMIRETRGILHGANRGKK